MIFQGHTGSLLSPNLMGSALSPRSWAGLGRNLSEIDPYDETLRHSNQFLQPPGLSLRACFEAR